MFDHNQPNFADRHIGPDADAVATMLKTIGVGSLDELADKALPAGILDALSDDGVAPGLDQLLPAASEQEALAELRAMADSNTVAVSMIGQGYFDTLTPPVLRRNILENPAWYTAYTPYQPEISQGRLEALLNFQTMVADLTGLEVANASMLDEGTAAAEAMTLMHRAVRGPSNRLAVDADVYRQTAADARHPRRAARHRDRHRRPSRRPARRRLLRCHHPAARRQRRSGRLDRVGRRSTRARRTGRGRRRPAGADADRPARRDRCRRRVRQHPTFRCANGIRRTARGLPRGARQACPAAARPAGRRVASTPTASPAYRLALQTREQHIRRDKATSNICTAQVLLAVIAAMYASYHGADGLAGIAHRVHGRAEAIAGALGDALVHDTFFDTVLARVPGRADDVIAAAKAEGHQPVARRRRPRLRLVRRGHHRRARRGGARGLRSALRPSRRARDIATRTSEFLTHPAFTRYRTETEMMRYLRSLADKDIALDRSMIPLGSCTMKLNAAAEMEPITWPEFSRQHPFAPASDTPGLRKLIADLETWLTAYHRVRRGVAAAERGFAGGVRRSAGDPGVSRRARRARPRRLPDPVERARHQRGVGRAGRHAGRGGGMPRQR